MIICLNCNLDWSTIATGLSAIATAFMAFIALRSLSQNKKQLMEENQARLVFEIVSYQNVFFLKIMNVGKSTAYDVNMCIKSNLIENHYSDFIKSVFEQINNKTFVFVPGRCMYFLLTPAHTTKQSKHTIGSKSYDAETTNKWLNENKDVKIVITGNYCKDFVIHEEFTINDFIGGAIVYDYQTLALQEIQKELKKNNDNIESIKALLDKMNLPYTNIVENDDIKDK